MASLFDPVPTVAPETHPSRGFDIQANPAAFGADVGRAVSGLGESVQGAARTGMEVLDARQQMNNEIHASELNTWLADRVTDKFNDYSKLEGKAAQDALPQFKTDVDQLYKDHMAQAGSLQEKTLLARNGRYLTTQYYRYATMHADRQFRTWADKTATDRAQSFGAQAGIAAANGDDDGMTVALNTSDDEVRKLYEQRGWGQSEIGVEAAKNRGRNLRQIIETQAVDDPVGAVARFKKWSDQMDPASRLATANHLRPLVTKLRGREIADEELGRAPESTGTGPDTVIKKFEEAGYTHEQASAAAGHFFHESRNDPNAVHDNGIGLGIAGWNRERLDALRRFAADRGKPANDFDTQVDFAIHELDTSEKASGDRLKQAGNVEEATTALMHYERPKGYTQANPTAGDGYGSRLGYAAKFASGDFTGTLPDKAETARRIIARTDGNPALQDAALAHANRIYRNEDTFQTQALGGFKTRLDDSVAEAWNTGSVRQPLTALDFVRVYGGDQGMAQYQRYQHTLQEAADVNSVAAMSTDEQDRLIAAREPQPGPGYADALQGQEKLRQAIDRTRKERAADPAGYAVRRLPGVAAAKAAMQSVLADQRTDEATRNAARSNYINTLMAAQERIGIPDDAQAPLTRDEAAVFALPLQHMLPGQERETLTDLAKELQQQYGDNAEAAFSYVLQTLKLNKETAKDAASVLRKLGLGTLDQPAGPIVSPEQRKLNERAEVNAAEDALYGRNAPIMVEPASFDYGRPSRADARAQVAEKGVNIPTGAIQYLRSNPTTAAQFDAIYGKGRAKQILDKYPVE